MPRVRFCKKKNSQNSPRFQFTCAGLANTQILNHHDLVHVTNFLRLTDTVRLFRGSAAFRPTFAPFVSCLATVSALPWNFSWFDLLFPELFPFFFCLPFSLLLPLDFPLPLSFPFSLPFWLSLHFILLFELISPLRRGVATVEMARVYSPLRPTC